MAATLAVVAGGYTTFQMWRLHGDIGEFRAAAGELRTAVDRRDPAGVDAAVVRLGSAAADADHRTSTLWWRALTHLPYAGDDAAGARAVARSLDLVAAGGIKPLAEVLVDFDHVTSDGRVDLELVHRLARPVASAQGAFAGAAELVGREDSSGYAGLWRSDFERYADFVTVTARGLASASSAVQILPTMLGTDGPRNYLLVFENNAEIRATGGLPGSWALLHADHGRLTMRSQGPGGDLAARATPVLPVTVAERRVYGTRFGADFRDANFTPDFPRAARLMAARWEEVTPDTRLDGVVAVDTVALSYLLPGIGSVPVNGVPLTESNAVDTLLNRVYLELPRTQQDAAFQAATRALFDRAMSGVVAPLKFVVGLDRAVGEGRLRVFSFHPADAGALAESRIAGTLSGPDGATPHVDITLNDATGSKMSYYLRYDAHVHATSCGAGVQSLQGEMTVDQTLPSAEAARLPDYVTGGGLYGVEPGSQLVLVRVYGPVSGSFSNIEVDGENVADIADVVNLAGRPVVTLAVQLWGKPVQLTWKLTTGPGQTGDTAVGVTPGLLPGSGDSRVASAC